MRKNLVTTVMAAIFFIIGSGSGGSTAQTATNLTDISGNWAYSQIIYLVNQGAISGYSDGTFRPENSITRAEFITVVNRAYGFNTTAPIYYNDVNPGDWYYSEIARAQAGGYISGYGDGKMAPNNPITREQAAAIMARVLQLDTSKAEDTLDFQDAASISGQLRAAVTAMAMSGIMNGYQYGTFGPLDSISRAESVAIISKGLELKLPTKSGFNVKDYGAKGDGINDDTTAIQKAVNYVYLKGGGIVYFPNGTYLINPDLSVKLQNNITLSLSPYATLKAIATETGYNAVISIYNNYNIKIVGGQIIGDRETHKGTTGTWGHGIRILGSNNIRIEDVAVANCWGDGIYIGSTDTLQNYCQDIIIENFNIDNNRRNGISVISAKDLIIRDGTISNSNGTDPQSGLDLEPNISTEYMQNILVENLVTMTNAAYGIVVGLGQYIDSPNGVSITIKNHIDYGSYMPIDFYEYFETAICKITVI